MEPVSIEGVSDPELVERARRGDDAAFGTLVDRHRTSVFRAVLAATGTREDAEEVAQEAFVAAYRHLEDFREDASFKTWLLSIAWRKALTRRRTVKTFLRRFVQPPEDTEWQVPDARRTQEQALLDDELRGPPAADRRTRAESSGCPAVASAGEARLPRHRRNARHSHRHAQMAGERGEETAQGEARGGGIRTGAGDRRKALGLGAGR
jgi:RNA polymerase sigma factor (sigma-70 family)